MFFDEQQGFNMNELARRLANLIRLGSIKEADYANATARVEIGDLVTDWLPWITARSGGDISWWAPEVAEQVIILSPSGDLSQGVILPAIYQSSSPPPENNADVFTVVFKDGTKITYDRATHKLNADVKGDIEIKAEKNIKCEAGEKIEAKAGGDLNAESGGNITIKASGNVNVEAAQATVKASSITLDGDATITGNGDINGNTNLGGGGAGVARIGDAVEVNPLTHKGTITAGSGKVKAG